MKKTTNDELPDFYNIQLERPKDDPGGYDCLFVDAASKVGHDCIHYAYTIPISIGTREISERHCDHDM